MAEQEPGGQRPPLPKRKYIRLPPEAYSNPSSAFTITIDTYERQRHFDVKEVNNQIVALLCSLAKKHRCLIKVYCLMPTHLHILIKPGTRSLVDFIGESKRKTADLARTSRGITALWQRSFFDHRLRSHESEAEQHEYIRDNPARAGLVNHPDDWPWTGSVEMG